MLDLESAIQHFDEVAEEKEKTAEVHAWNDDGYSELECLNCASKHRQIAKWLKELKAYREVEEIIKGICKDRCEFPDDVPVMCGACWIGSVIEIFDNMLGGDEDDVVGN